MDYQTMVGLAAPLALGMAAIGSALGLGKAVGAAMEAMGRQPEAAGDIRTSMIIAAALIEGISLFGQVVCIVLAVK